MHHSPPPSPSSGIIVLTTVSSEIEAERIATTLVSERLCGCISVSSPVSSTYRWKGAVTTERELQLEIKTTLAALPSVRRRLLELHPYELPGITVVPVEYGASFGRWIEGEVAPPSGGAIPSTATSLPSVAILASGRGSNALALIERQQLEGYRIAAVISDNTDAPVITVARDRGIMTTTHPRALWGTTLRCQERIADTLLDIAPDIIVLAGFMQILKPWFVDMFVGRLINIHPSLLPKYPGLDTHRRALEAGDTRHGATVHLVDRGVDTGPIIAQVSVPCVSTDTPEELGARVLAQEHRLFPWVVGAIARGEIQPSENSVVISTEAREAGGALGFLLPE